MEIENELKDKQLEKITGGNDNTSDNPKGLIEGDNVYFYYQDIDKWMWGTFLYYYNGKYRIKWNDTKIIFGSGMYMTVYADEDSIPEEYVK